jgi:hypothetical protein
MLHSFISCGRLLIGVKPKWRKAIASHK